MDATTMNEVSVDPERFREAMSRVGAAVHIVTTAGTAGTAGLTANAVTSVTAEPPTMLFCVNKTARAAPVILENGVFCVNTLASADQTLSDIFAGRTPHSAEERFSAGTWGTLTTGAPVLTSALAAFDCRILEVKEMSTHFILIGRVEAVEIAPKTEALMYVHRTYWQL
jgi:flavin reductase (DIM6/NTAB) family NADH-FMN oxidoreductase RutF